MGSRQKLEGNETGASIKKLGFEQELRMDYALQDLTVWRK
jgi:hypothetical protein